MKISIVAGARPNFIKVAPIIHAIQRAKDKGKNISYRLIHTGQHYDKRMSETFFEDLKIPQPDVNLECGGGTQAEQTAAILVAFEKEVIQHPVDLVLVVGDVTSTMACAIVAKKQNIKVAHVEAGIRSGDQTMPEEINRLVTDSITDFYFTTSEVANSNLRNEGVSNEKIFFVGNVMIDTLKNNSKNFIKPPFFDEFGLEEQKYLVLTLHRPSNVDESESLRRVITELICNSNNLPIIFPIHPRTAKVFADLDINAPNLFIVDPLGYLEFNYLVQNSIAVVTDSGGITEETTVMGVPCITLRDSTERPETVTVGTNVLIGTNPKMIKPTLQKLFSGDWKQGGIPDKWDGLSSIRIVEKLLELKLGE